MKSKYLFTTIVTAVMLLDVAIAQADSSRIVYPPAGNSIMYKYPQQPMMPIRPTAPNLYGQANNGMMPNMNRRPLPQRNMARYPAQGRAPFPMPNRYPAGRLNNQRYQQVPPANQYSNFGSNRSNPFNSFSGGNNPMSNMFSNNSNNTMPFFGNRSMPFSNANNSMPFFGTSNNKKRKKAWGNKRNIWPDFYTDFTDEAWDTMSSGPRDMGRMPGGWRFPHISTPDPVTVGDAITNQFPPIMEEGGNMMDFSDWGVFD